MQRALVVKGRLTGPRSVELEEDVTEAATGVDVVVRLPARPNLEGDDIITYLRGLPAGKRTKDEIDRQIQEERDSWGDR